MEAEIIFSLVEGECYVVRLYDLLPVFSLGNNMLPELIHPTSHIPRYSSVAPFSWVENADSLRHFLPVRTLEAILTNLSKPEIISVGTALNECDC